ncbi:MAG: GTP-binding protein [Actinomycetota bacterium]|nr:GTP-binding protein [Actinomycetota bacterium]
MDLLRFSTVGSVDDGKSTLIGRLLFDSDLIPEDQLLAISLASRRRGSNMNLALLTDGLRAEREDGITIDVAYRYFATPRRKFIIADTPGHFGFTRNMVTGASTADVGVVLVDVTRGLLEQSRRHAAIASLLGVPRLIVCVNKMDLVEFAPPPFEKVRDAFDEFARGLAFTDVTYLPISALYGDNVVTPSRRMHWYGGPSLLECLEAIPTIQPDGFEAGRMSIQLVIETATDGPGFLGYAGRVDGGIFHRGDDVMSMATGRRLRITRITSNGRAVDAAVESMSVLLELEPSVRLGRGDLLVFGAPPISAHRLTASICWMAPRPLMPGARYTIKHLTRTVSATCVEICERWDINTHERVRGVTALELNEIGVVDLGLDDFLFVDTYRANRATGSFIIIDDETNDTVGAGMIEAAA